MIRADDVHQRGIGTVKAGQRKLQILNSAQKQRELGPLLELCPQHWALNNVSLTDVVLPGLRKLER
jgi:hypothetical protein